MYVHETLARDGAKVIVFPTGRSAETHIFGSEEEAEARLRFVSEGLTWVGTPFADCADVKGPRGAVDCAMLLVRCSVDTGLLPPFDPRPYRPRHMLHRTEQKFLGWVQDKLGGMEVDAPRLGDVIVWQFGKVFSHGAILINATEVVHAYGTARMCLVSRRDEDLLKHMSLGHQNFPRPVKYFDIWKGRKWARS